MPNRILLIHGYVEDPTIFDQLIPHLPNVNFVRINLADEFLRWQPTGSIDVQMLAQYLTNYYKITDNDFIIGHSMGGWIAIHIKQLTGAGAIQVGSWTDPKKILFPTDSLAIVKFLLYSGISQSRLVNNYFRKKYPFHESRTLYNGLVDGSMRMTRLYLWQQAQILFAKVPPPTVSPDLRIHARRDNIIRFPDEPFAEVPGDHFSLVFHPERVAEAIWKVV